MVIFRGRVETLVKAYRREGSSASKLASKQQRSTKESLNSLKIITMYILYSVSLNPMAEITSKDHLH